jgi:DNA polymerase
MPNELKSELQKAVGQARGILVDLQRIGIGEVCRQPEFDNFCFNDQTASEQMMQEPLTQAVTDLAECQHCSLSDGQNMLVFGAGDIHADLVFIGDGPGQNEDRIGLPFSGEAGQLLDRILNAMGLSREQIYLCNVVRCLPSKNRNPNTDQIDLCEPLLARQLETIQPKIIVTLGDLTTETLLKPEVPISKLRGEWQLYNNMLLMPTLHPVDLIRNPIDKRIVWDAMKAVLKRLNDDALDDN